MRVLLVEDEPELAEALIEVLTDDRYTVDHAAEGEAAARLMAASDYALVILDWQIPAPTGIDLLRQWREAGDVTPVLMLTGDRTRIRDKVEGLDVGADDYLTKPFAIAELRARVRMLMRRRDGSGQSRLEVDDLVLDRATRRVTLGDDEIHLSPKEFALLECLMSSEGVVLKRSELFEQAWKDPFDPTSNVVDVLIHRIRKKIDGGRDTKLLQTVAGVGYVLRSKRR